MKKEFIRLIDIVAEIIRKWYVLAICIVVFSVIFPCYKYMLDKSNIQSESVSTAQSSVETSPDSGDLLTDSANDTVRFKTSYFILGAASGAVIGALVIIVFFCIDGHIKSDVEIYDCFGINYLGRINSSSEKKPLETFIDTLCYKEFCNEDISLSAARISGICNSNNINNIPVSGNIVKLNANVEKLIEQLGTLNINTTWFDNFSSKPETLKIISESRNILLIYEMKKTLFKDVSNDIEVLNEQGINIIGYMTVK